MITTTIQEAAREQYFNGRKTQAQIAADLNIHAKTLSYWIKQNKWREARNAARQMPLFLKNNLYSQLAHLQIAILTRAPEQRFPDRHEAEVQRKLLAGIKQMPNLALPEAIEMMTEFTNGLERDKCQIVREVTLLCDNFIQKKVKSMDLGYDSSWLEDQHLLAEEDDIAPQPPETITPKTPDLRLTTHDLQLNNVDNSGDNIFSKKDKNQENITENQSLAEQPQAHPGIKKDKTIHIATTTSHPAQQDDYQAGSGIENETPSQQTIKTTARKKIFNKKPITRKMDNIGLKR